MTSTSPSTLIDFALTIWKADPAVRIEDAYKWIFQATRGGEHLVPSRETARLSLEKEWHSVSGIHEGERLWDPLSPGGEVGRLNIRPYKASGGSVEDLLNAFILSSQSFQREGSAFEDVWQGLGDRLRAGSHRNLSFHDWSSLDAEQREKEYPAISHSQQYRTDHFPAYRILTFEAGNHLCNIDLYTQ